MHQLEMSRELQPEGGRSSARQQVPPDRRGPHDPAAAGAPGGLESHQRRDH